METVILTRTNNFGLNVNYFTGLLCFHIFIGLFIFVNILLYAVRWLMRMIGIISPTVSTVGLFL